MSWAIQLGEAIGNWISTGESPVEHIKSDYLSLELELLSELLSWVFGVISDIVFDFIFKIHFDDISILGNKILNLFYDKFCSMEPSFSGLSFYVGLIFFLFVLKKAISIIRG